MIYTLPIKESLQTIFSGILVGGIRKDNPDIIEKKKSAKICMSRFLGTYQNNIFQDEYAVYYDVIVNLNAKTFTPNQLSELIDMNRDIILRSPSVDLTKYTLISDGRQTTDDEKVEAFKEDLVELLITLSNEVVSEDEFTTACSVFSEWYKNQFMLETAQAMTRIMSDIGYEERLPKGRMRRYQGYRDCQTYYQDKMRILMGLSDDNKIKTLVVNADWFEKEMLNEDVEDDDTLFTYGIPEIDEKLGEFRRGNMLGILGPPKAGKTRITNFTVQRALSLGLNVAVWPVEGKKEEWIANQLACYIKRVSGVSVNSKDILQKKYLNNPALKSYVASAKLALATDTSMGRLSFIEGSMNVETYLDILKSHYDNDNPYDVVVIDSVINVMSMKGKNKVERISEAYMGLKNFVANELRRPALAIVPAQLKQSVVDEMRKNPDETLEVTAGGESAETIRTPDTVIGIFSTKEERKANIMHIYSVASRHSEDFDDFMIRTDLKCCYLYSDGTLN